MLPCPVRPIIRHTDTIGLYEAPKDLAFMVLSVEKAMLDIIFLILHLSFHTYYLNCKVEMSTSFIDMCQLTKPTRGMED